jgi:hypothetical protein
MKLIIMFFVELDLNKSKILILEDIGFLQVILILIVYMISNQLQ